MEKYSLAAPSLFGDHHVIEVRRILSALPGILDIYASSNYRIIMLDYDPAQVKPEEIYEVLEETGYLEELPTPTEIHGTKAENGQKPFFRHTTAYPNIKNTVSFTQKVPADVKPLWPCPGVPLPAPTKEEQNG